MVASGVEDETVRHKSRPRENLSRALAGCGFAFYDMYFGRGVLGSCAPPIGPVIRVGVRSAEERDLASVTCRRGRRTAERFEGNTILGSSCVIAEHARPDQRIFVGVTDPIDPRVETAEEVRDRVLEAAQYIDPARLGTCDDCGFAPFGDDTSTTRQTAFAKISARVAGTQLAARELGL